MFAGGCVHAAYPDNLACVIETMEGSVVTQVVQSDGHSGHAHAEDEEIGNNFVVLYQKGILANPKPVERSHHSILSPYIIMNEAGDKKANVPWKNFSWSPPAETPYLVPMLDCGVCLKPGCKNCKGSISHLNVKVVWMHNKLGDVRYQWYVISADKPNTLRALPYPFMRHVLKGVKKSPVGCTCGRCSHPLASMVNSRSVRLTQGFSSDAISVFSEYRARVKLRVNEEKNNPQKSKKRHRDECRTCDDEGEGMQHMVEGTCTICLEDTFVSRGSCVQKGCTSPICVECRRRTRGLCPLCDRTKLSKDCRFMCYTCNRGVFLDEFGYECVTCGKPHVCLKCYKGYGQCLQCECDNASSPYVQLK